MHFAQNVFFSLRGCLYTRTFLGLLGPTLAEDIRKLCRYYREHEAYLSWDLHGDNLMRRTKDGEIVVMDPFAPKMGEYLTEI